MNERYGETLHFFFANFVIHSSVPTAELSCWTAPAGADYVI